MTDNPDLPIGYLQVPLPGIRATHHLLGWFDSWPPPNVLAIVYTKKGRFPNRIMPMDAVDWIAGTTMIPGADLARFYRLFRLEEEGDATLRSRTTAPP